MNRLLKYSLLTILLALVGISKSDGSAEINDDPLLMFNRVADKLKALKSVSYHYTREFTYPSENYQSKAEGDIFIDFAKEKTWWDSGTNLPIIAAFRLSTIRNYLMSIHRKRLSPGKRV